MKRPASPREAELVLVGGGHAHVQVLKGLAMEPIPGVRTTLVVDTPIAVYSGMVPGFVAGQYAAPELEIDVLPLARLAGARVVLAPATAVDAERGRVELEGRPALPFDALSLDIGSTVTGLGIPGVREHALPTRPIGRFVERLDRRLSQISHRESPRVAVVGGGAGGVELAFSIRERLLRRGRTPEVRLLEAGDRILAGYPAALAERVGRAAEARGIRIETGRPVEAIEADAVVIDGERLPADLVLWVTGAAPNARFRPGELRTDERGFLLTDPALRVLDHANVFAVGDCATPDADPWMPKAGVYAVRQGPVLGANLRRLLGGGGRLRPYRPQRDFLTLLNLGDGTAIGAKWGRSFSGTWVFRWKDRIDRRFMRRYQTLGEAGIVSPAFSELAGMRAEMDVLCGGCAAKLGQDALGRALERLGAPDDPGVELGIAQGDDAAAYATPGGERVVSSVDQFRAFTEDPFLVGRVGAVNAVSDVLAKGVRAAIAQALIALPEDDSEEGREETLYQVLAGARRAFDDMGVTLVGGHTTTASELLVGFQVEGFAPAGEPLLSLDGLEPDQALILTKALGTGVLFHADMKGRARGPWIEAAIRSMLRPNTDAARIARSHGASAATDVTGFGLAQHLASMLRASALSAELDLGALPALDGARELLAQGLRSTFHPENERADRGISASAEARAHPSWPLLFDPQTSGGLVFGVPPERSAAVVAKLREAGDGAAAVIGHTAPAGAARLRVTIEAAG